ncbi:GAF domain-containing protein [Desulfogranum japonicum]|uniref:GAF domain-containing protein n=1 Tax=Desulfogranum japonicum TaxID=231447 RepID=UPI000427EEEB|nr:GAF domain-containing protein [Desulfogranum japonicum]
MNSTMQSGREQGYLQVFQEVTRLISGVHDSQQVMDLVVRRLPVLLEVDAATIRLFDAGTDRFVLGAAWGVSDEYLSRSIIDTEEVMAELLAGKPTARKDIDQNCDHADCAYISNEGVKSAMSLPILYKGELTGLLRLLTKRPREFAEAEINFAMSLAEQVGVALANSHMIQELENQVKFFQAQREISKLVNSTLNLEQVLTAIVEKLPGIMGVKGCTIRLLEPATNRLKLVAAHGVSEKYLNRGSINREDSIFKVLKGEPVAIYDAPNDTRVNYHKEIMEEGIKSILAIPIKNEQEIIGVLRLLSDTHHLFSANEIHFAVTAAAEGGNAIEKARTYRKINLLFNQIEEHERFLQTILDSLWMELLVVDPSSRVIMANKIFLNTRGFTEEEILGQLHKRVSPWYVDDMQCPLQQVLQTGKPVTVVKEYDVEEGEAGWLERHLTPIIGEHGQVDFVVEAVNDITDQVKLEQEHSRRMKLQGVIEMAGTAAHELNTPLFAALGTAQLLREDLEEPDMIEEMDLIISNMKKMGELTRKMVDLTGYSSSEYVGDTRIINLQKEQ